MRKRYRQIFYAALFGSIICAIAIAGISRGGNRSSSPNAPASRGSVIQQGSGEGKLRKGAREKGHYVVTWDDPQWKQTLDIKRLVKNSSLIVIGKPARNTCKLSQDGERITIDYDVIVNEVIKGNTVPGDHLAVSIPGGMVRFEDGTSAEFRSLAFGRKMVNEASYVLFLSPEDKRDSILVPTGGPQGIFEISRDGARTMHFSADFTAPPPPFQNLATVLDEIRNAVKK